MTSHPLPYYDVMRHSKDSRFLRLRLVRFAQKHGIRSAAQAFSTRRKTVRKWLRRYEEGGYAALADRSRAPKNPVRKIPKPQRRRALELKRKLPSWGAQRIKDQFGLTISEKAIRKIWREEGLLKRKRRKHKTKQNLRKIKKLWKLFEQTDVDTKDLDDIPELWPQIQCHQLPTIQYTAREVVSGTQFLAYAYERSLTFSTFWIELLTEHLSRCGMDLTGCRFQTDNGSEFIGSWNAKNDSAFTLAVQASGADTTPSRPVPTPSRPMSKPYTASSRTSSTRSRPSAASKTSSTRPTPITSGSTSREPTLTRRTKPHGRSSTRDNPICPKHYSHSPSSSSTTPGRNNRKPLRGGTMLFSIPRGDGQS